MNHQLLAAWSEYRKSPNTQTRNKLALLYMPLAKLRARKAHARLDGHIPLDDLEQYAFVGLLAAIKSFDPIKGEPGPYIASKISFAIMDAVREEDPSPRLIRTMNRAIAQLRVRLGHNPNAREIRKHLKYSPKSLQNYLTSHYGVPYSIDELISRSNLDSPSNDGGDVLGRAVQHHDDHERRLADRDQVDTILSRLNPLDRQIAVGYWMEGKCQRVIGAGLGISESRVSQLRKYTMARLKQAAHDMR